MNSNPAMRFKSALTKDDLTAIQERSADSPDVRALLWEVARLRALALRRMTISAKVLRQLRLSWPTGCARCLKTSQ